MSGRRTNVIKRIWKFVENTDTAETTDLSRDTSDFITKMVSVFYSPLYAYILSEAILIL